MKKTLLIFIAGAAVGGVGVFYGKAPALVALGVEGREVEATVVEERREESGRLVLLLRDEAETMLATFEQRADDVASLVAVGDRLTIRSNADGVFADDALIVRVLREGEASEDTEDADADEADEEVMDADELVEGADAVDAEDGAADEAESEGNAAEPPDEPGTSTGDVAAAPGLESASAES